MYWRQTLVWLQGLQKLYWPHDIHWPHARKQCNISASSQRKPFSQKFTGVKSSWHCNSCHSSRPAQQPPDITIATCNPQSASNGSSRESAPVLQSNPPPPSGDFPLRLSQELIAVKWKSPNTHVFSISFLPRGTLLEYVTLPQMQKGLHMAFPNSLNSFGHLDCWRKQCRKHFPQFCIPSLYLSAFLFFLSCFPICTDSVQRFFTFSQGLLRVQEGIERMPAGN